MPLKTIAGQETAVRQLTNALASGRVAHAYLFVGPCGVGKRTCAILFAQALKGEISLLQPEGSSIKIEQIRALQKNIYLKPQADQKKIYLLHEVEKMTAEAANSLLKILEEPPAYAVLILLTSAPYGLLKTVQSRCQKVFFQRLPESSMRELLSKRTDLQAEKVELILRLAQGSFAHALHYVEQPEFWQKRDRLWALLEQCSQGKKDKFFSLAETLEKTDRQAVQEDLILLTGYYRDILIWQRTKKNRLLLHIDKAMEIEKISACLTLRQLEQNIRFLEETGRLLKRNANIKLALEVLFLQLSTRGEDDECIRSLA